MELEYDTYESMTYEEHSQVLHKRAIVYPPYGYSEEEPYNVFYLMHGGWSSETTYLYFLEQEGGVHSGEYAQEYFYNGLCWIWQ